MQYICKCSKISDVLTAEHNRTANTAGVITAVSAFTEEDIVADIIWEHHCVCLVRSVAADMTSKNATSLRFGLELQKPPLHDNVTTH